MNAIDVAKWFIIRASKEEDCTEITNMKVNKLCYYAFLLYYHITGKKLFNENIEAWPHGPVVKTVYHHFSNFNCNTITIDDDYDDLEFDNDDNEREQDVLQRTYDRFMCYSPYYLREMTHQEAPWRQCYEAGRRDIVIPEQILFDFANSQMFANYFQDQRD